MNWSLVYGKEWVWSFCKSCNIDFGFEYVGDKVRRTELRKSCPICGNSGDVYFRRKSVNGVDVPIVDERIV